MASLALVVVACAGRAFDADDSGGGGSAASGGTAHGGSSGSGETDGGGSGGSGGSAAGGSGGSGGGMGATGGSGATGGGGGGNCPAVAPTAGSPCQTLDDACSYENGCCFDTFTCTVSGWRYEGCGVLESSATCPDVVPVSGLTCDECTTPLACVYESCDTQGRYVASCNAGVWSVRLEPCGDVSCGYGSEFAQQFDKLCAVDTDCTTETIAANCCGTSLVVGVNLFEAAALRTAWAACVSELAWCGCPEGPPMAEDGQTATDLFAIKVRCSAGECSTYVP